jgi:hypothetical protein
LAPWSDRLLLNGPQRAGRRANDKEHDMAILSGVTESGEEALYDIPDADLAKHKLDSVQLTDEIRVRLFPGKDKLTKDDAQGVIATAPGAESEVQGYAAICRYWINDGTTLVWWYDYC